MTHQEDVFRAAQLYASMSWPVIPLYGIRKDGSCYCAKGSQCGSPGKHPCLTKWQEHASCDFDQIDAWFKDPNVWPKFPANVGVQLGPRGNLCDFEYDNAAGAEFIKRLFGGNLPPTIAWKSGMGGHCGFEYSVDLMLGANVSLPGCDLKLGTGNKGSQSVMPPSKHWKNPAGYRFGAGLAPGEIELARVPPLVIENLHKYMAARHKTTEDGAGGGDGNWASAMGGVPEGSRNHSMTRFVGKVLRQTVNLDGAGQLDALLKMQDINARQKPPLPAEELADIWFSILGAERKRRGDTRGDKPGFEFKPVFIPDINEIEKVDWLWEGWLPARSSMELVGAPKVGKTTLYTALLREFAVGGELAGGTVYPAKVLVITEESEGIWKERHEIKEIGGHVAVLSRPFRGSPSFEDWEKFVETVTAEVEAGTYEVIIIDPWVNLNPAPDENDAKATNRACTPLYTLMKAGAAIILVHHDTKAPAALGKSGRGSGALAAFVDVILEFKRVKNDASETKRDLQGLSRYAETPLNPVQLDFNNHIYKVSKGTTPAIELTKKIEKIFNGKPMKLAEIVGLIPGSTRSTVQRRLNELTDKGIVGKTGGGSTTKYQQILPDVIPESDLLNE